MLPEAPSCACWRAPSVWIARCSPHPGVRSLQDAPRPPRLFCGHTARVGMAASGAAGVPVDGWLDEADFLLSQWAFAVDCDATVDAVGRELSAAFTAFIVSQGLPAPTKCEVEGLFLDGESVGAGRDTSARGLESDASSGDLPATAARRAALEPPRGAADSTERMKCTLALEKTGGLDGVGKIRVALRVEFQFSGLYGEKLFSEASAQAGGDQYAKGAAVWRTVHAPESGLHRVSRSLVVHVTKPRMPVRCPRCAHAYEDPDSTAVRQHNEAHHPKTALAGEQRMSTPMSGLGSPGHGVGSPGPAAGEDWLSHLIPRVCCFRRPTPELAFEMSKPVWPVKGGDLIWEARHPLRSLTTRGLMAEMSFKFWDAFLLLKDGIDEGFWRPRGADYAPSAQEGGSAHAARPATAVAHARSRFREWPRGARRPPSFSGRTSISSLEYTGSDGQDKNLLDDLPDFLGFEIPLCIDMSREEWEQLQQLQPEAVMRFKLCVWDAAQQLISDYDGIRNIPSWNPDYAEFDLASAQDWLTPRADGKIVVRDSYPNCPFVITGVKVDSFRTALGGSAGAGAAKDIQNIDMGATITDERLETLRASGNTLREGSPVEVDQPRHRRDHKLVGRIVSPTVSVISVTGGPTEEFPSRFRGEFYATPLRGADDREFVRICKVCMGHPPERVRAVDIWDASRVRDTLAVIRALHDVRPSDGQHRRLVAPPPEISTDLETLEAKRDSSATASIAPASATAGASTNMEVITGQGACVSRYLERRIMVHALRSVGLFVWESHRMTAATNFVGVEPGLRDYILVAAPLHVLRRRAEYLSLNVAVLPMGLGGGEKGIRLRRIIERQIEGRLSDKEADALARYEKTERSYTADNGYYPGGFLQRHFLRRAPLAPYVDPHGPDSQKNNAHGEREMFAPFSSVERQFLLLDLITRSRIVKAGTHGEVDKGASGVGLTLVELVAEGVVNEVYPLHDTAEEQWMDANWVALSGATMGHASDLAKMTGPSPVVLGALSAQKPTAALQKNCADRCVKFVRWFGARMRALRTSRATAVARYFGHATGFYTLWVNYYTNSLIIASVVGVLFGLLEVTAVSFEQETVEGNITVHELLLVLYAVFMMVWATVMLQLFERRSDTYAYLWNCGDMAAAEPIRGEFIVALQRSTRDQAGVLADVFNLPAQQARRYKERQGSAATGRTTSEDAARLKNSSSRGDLESQSTARAVQPMQLDDLMDDLSFFNELYFFPPGLQRYRKLLSGAVSVLMVCVVVVTMIVVLFVPPQLFGESEFQGIKVKNIVSGVANGTLIPLYNWVYQQVAMKLNEYELHRHESERFASLVMKRFLFQFFNSYLALIYILVVERDLTRLSSQLAGVFITQQVFGTIKQHGLVSGLVYLTERSDEVASKMPCVTRLFVLLGIKQGARHSVSRKEKEIIESRASRMSNCGSRSSSTATTSGRRPFKEMKAPRGFENDGPPAAVSYNRLRGHILAQAVLQSRKPEAEDVLEEYLELVIQFGFVALFCAAFPLAPLTAFVNNVLEIRLDARKFVVVRRFFAQQASGIGVWFSILQFLSVVAVVTNTLIIVAVMRDQAAENRSKLVSAFPGLTDVGAVWVFIVFEHLLVLLKMVLRFALDDEASRVKEDRFREHYYHQKVKDYDEVLEGAGGLSESDDDEVDGSDSDDSGSDGDDDRGADELKSSR